jgi:hypothetical protein
VAAFSPGAHKERLASLPVSDFAVLAPDGTVQVEPFYTVVRFAPSKYGLATLGRPRNKWSTWLSAEECAS